MFRAYYEKETHCKLDYAIEITEENMYDPNKEKFPIQVLSSASHYFIGDSFQSVPRLQAIMGSQFIFLHSLKNSSVPN